MSDPKNEIPASLSRSMKSSGVEITGHREINHATQYKLIQGADKANLNVYHTGKISVDGARDSELKRLLENWRLANSGSKSRSTGDKLENSKKPVANSTPRVGTDEAGKGEYLGPLVVAGVRVVGEAQDAELREAGVRDSKDLSKIQARAISARVMEIVGSENICLITLDPMEYDRRREAADRNVNRLLGELNVEIINELKAEIEAAVVDSFGTKARSYIKPHIPEGINLEVRPKAEDDTGVAAASIVARARYLEEMDRLSEEVGFELPRGSAHVLEVARRVARELGVEGLKKVAKVHFSTTEKVLEGISGAKER
ncbi:MAG: ribonuclease HIII [Rubrobacteraceae bacterium]